MFSKGKNFLTESGRVVKLLGKKQEFEQHIEECEDTVKRNLYRWKGPPTANLFAGRVYEESLIKEYDELVSVDLGMNVIYLNDGDRVVAVRGSKKKFNEFLELVVEPKEEKKPNYELIFEDETIKKREYVTEIVKEEKLVGPAWTQRLSGEQGPVGDIGPQGPPGKDGVDGKDGVPGQQGPVGVPGKGEKGEKRGCWTTGGTWRTRSAGYSRRSCRTR